MKKWQIENLETLEISEISEILFRVSLFPSFQFCPTAKSKKLGFKNLGNKFRDFRCFLGFRVFDLAVLYLPTVSFLLNLKSHFLTGVVRRRAITSA